jgi:leucyl aminopeptidase (aminopeptidase T)
MQRAVDRVLDQCLAVGAGEQVLLVTDDGSDAAVVEALSNGLVDRGAAVRVATVPRLQVPGEEPPDTVAGWLVEADAAIELTSLFMGSSQARQRATAAGTRYLAMPGVRMDTFRDGGPLDVDFAHLRHLAEVVGAAWTAASVYRLTTPAGTDLRGGVTDRPGRVLHGIASQSGAYMAPPDVEAGTAPVEGTSSGVVIVDADLLFMGPGPLQHPVELTFRTGELTAVDGAESARLTEMMDRCDDPRMTNLAEVSLGLNPSGTVCGVPMETESSLGTAHIALGNSIAYGGVVAARAHLDCVMRDATLELDGRPVMSCGKLV